MYVVVQFIWYTIDVVKKCVTFWPNRYMIDDVEPIQTALSSIKANISIGGSTSNSVWFYQWHCFNSSHYVRSKYLWL